MLRILALAERRDDLLLGPAADPRAVRGEIGRVRRSPGTGPAELAPGQEPRRVGRAVERTGGVAVAAAEHRHHVFAALDRRHGRRGGGGLPSRAGDRHHRHDARAHHGRPRGSSGPAHDSSLVVAGSAVRTRRRPRIGPPGRVARPILPQARHATRGRSACVGEPAGPESAPAMRSIRLALAQLNPTVGDLEGNFRRVAASIEQARRMAVDILALPEMVITGYMPEDLLLKPSFIERAIERTRALAPLTEGITVIVGTVERDLDLFNSAAILHDGRWGGSYRKRYLPNYGVFDENRYFMPARTSPVFSRAGTVFGVSICEDIWYPGGPVEEQVIRGGAEILINLSASPYHAGKAQARKRMLCTRAADNLAAICYVNLVGGQDEVVFDGASLILDEQ